MTQEAVFEVRAYSFQELALFYAPDLSIGAATNRLSQWIRKSEGLKAELLDVGWRVRSKNFTPMQVQVIVDYLGAP
jgi:hypothetical protein